jgi:tetratricopeptide (TPR) repeat protein
MHALRTATGLATFAIFLLVLAPTAHADALADGKAALAKKDWAAAEAHFREVLEKTPGQRDAALGMARIVDEGGRIEAYPWAEEHLGLVLEAKPDDVQAQLALGQTFLGRGRILTADVSTASDAGPAFADARMHFEAVLKAQPTSDVAAAGIAESHWHGAAFDETVQFVDEFLAKAPKSPKALYWKGKAFYIRAVDAFKQTQQVSAEAKDLFQKARNTFEAAATADPTHHDAWLHAAYSAQYLGDAAGAEKAYEKAMDADPLNELPLRGIEALHAHDTPDKKVALYARLAKDHPKNVAVRWYLGWQYFNQQKWDDAIRTLSAYVAEVPSANGLTYLGQAYEQKKETAKARDAYERALDADPTHTGAAGLLEAMIRDPLMSNVNTANGVKAMIAAYEPLIKRVPDNPFVPNNLAFILRENAGQGAAATPILQESVRFYEMSSAIVDRLTERPDLLTWTERMDYAGIYNDTGLMYMFYPAIRDVERAREYFEKALELTEDGEPDACQNLVRLHSEEGDPRAAFEVAERCSEGIRNKQGEPDMAGRERMRREADRLRPKGE